MDAGGRAGGRGRGGVPALSRIEHAAVGALAEELRFAPKGTLLKHIKRVEELATLVDADGVYPEDFVVFRVTGYRPEITNPRLIGGVDLRRDLSALCERLCESAHLRPQDDETGTITYEELASRWGVSRKTIERYRKDGLVARRVDKGSGRRAIVFSIRSVEAFEQANEERLGKAAAFSRLNEHERAKCVRWARRYARVLGWNRTRCADRASARLGRSREAARLALLEHDERSGDPIFTRRAPSDADQRAELLDRFVRGDTRTPGRGPLAHADTGTLTRLVDRARHERIGAALSGPLAPFDDPGGDAHVIDDERVRSGLVVECPATLSGLVALMREERAQDAKEQAVRATAASLLVTRSRAGYGALNPARPSAGALDAIETDLRWAVMLRVMLVRTQFQLVLNTIEQRLGGPIGSLDAARAAEILEGAIETSHLAVCGYDPTLGGRLSARVNIAMSRYAARIRDVAAPTREGKAARIISSEHAVGDWTRTLWRPWGWLRPPLLDRAGSLDDEHLDLLTKRHGLDGERPRTLSGLAQERGVTPGAMRRHEQSALHALARVTNEND